MMSLLISLLAAARAQSAFSTTSAITIAPVIGLCFGRTSDMRTSRMAVDHRLDLLGMNLQAADIDDAAAAADEEVAIAAPLHHVAGIDEAVAIRARRTLRAEIALRRARRADPQRTVDDLQLDAVAAMLQEARPESPARPSSTSKATPASVEA